MSLFMASVIVASLSSSCASAPRPVGTATPVDKGPIGLGEVRAAQRAWCDALLSISAESARGGDARAVAELVLASAYDYERGPVLFKPTLAHSDQTFRMNKRGALAYLVGGDEAYPNDTGFARKPWIACSAQVAGISSVADKTFAMGAVYLTRADGVQVRIDNTFGYVRGPDGKVRIVLHHSSLPYEP